MASELRSHFIRITAALAALICLSGVAATLSFDRPRSVSLTHAASAAAVSEPMRTAPPAAPEPTPTSLTTVLSAPSTTVAAATAVAPRTSTTSSTVSTGAIAGRVTHDGRPVAGARLSIAGVEGVTEAVSDANGRYRFDRVTPGDHDAYLVAESVPVPCTADGICIGSALAMEHQPVSVRPGVDETMDWGYPYADPPTYSTDYATPPFRPR